MLSVLASGEVFSTALGRMGVSLNSAPHLMQMTCSGLTPTPHCRQNFLYPVGLKPHDKQATACSATAFPQFVQKTCFGVGGNIGTGWTGGGGTTGAGSDGSCIGKGNGTGLGTVMEV